MSQKNTIKSQITTLSGKFFSASWPSAILVFILAFWFRLEKLEEIPRRWLAPNPGWELDSIAITLVKTGQFANPYMIQTGPTAHLPPIYPWLVSLIYRTFGLTEQAGFLRHGLMIVSASILLAMLPWLGEKLGLGRVAGLLGGFVGAWIVEWAGHGEFLTGIGLGLILILFLNRWTKQTPTWFGSLSLGILSGVVFHIQPAVLLVVIGCLIFELWWSKGSRKFLQVGLVIMGIMAASLPWAWRNYQVFGQVTFIRSNFGLELRMGNHEGAAATMEIMDQQEEEHHHPSTHLKDALLLREVGEIEYMRQARDEASDWIWNNPGQFTKLAMLRFFNLWFGPTYLPWEALKVSILTLLAIGGFRSRFEGLSPAQRSAILIPLISYPGIYYFMAYMPRYRIPIDWIIYILAGAGILSIIKIVKLAIANRARLE